jgi:hypothetical protein
MSVVWVAGGQRFGLSGIERRAQHPSRIKRCEEGLVID